MEALATAFEERLAEIEAYLAFLEGIEAEARSGMPRLGLKGTVITTQQQRSFIPAYFCNFIILSKPR